MNDETVQQYKKVDGIKQAIKIEKDKVRALKGTRSQDGNLMQPQYTHAEQLVFNLYIRPLPNQTITVSIFFYYLL